MSKINHVSSAPDYIMKFIKFNQIKLEEIYKEGIEKFKEGVLGFKCSKEKNKMDVFFMDELMILKMITKESWDNLKNSNKEKKIFLVNDLDRNSMFIIYI